jgi:hypothetical protein
MTYKSMDDLPDVVHSFEYGADFAALLVPEATCEQQSTPVSQPSCNERKASMTSIEPASAWRMGVDLALSRGSVTVWYRVESRTGPVIRLCYERPERASLMLSLRKISRACGARVRSMVRALLSWRT